MKRIWKQAYESGTERHRRQNLTESDGKVVENFSWKCLHSAGAGTKIEIDGRRGTARPESQEIQQRIENCKCHTVTVFGSSG